MLTHPLVLKAIDFATRAHGDQKRKYSGQPYVTHCIAVAEILSEYVSDPEILVSGILHDVVEDTSTTLDQIRAEFGDRVAAMVDDLTDVSKPSDGNRKFRKAMDLAHSAAASADSQTIKLADILHNTLAISSADPGFAPVWLREKRDQLKVLTKGDKRLHERVTALVEHERQALRDRHNAAKES